MRAKLLPLLALAISLNTFAQDFTLIKDLYRDTNSDPGNSSNFGTPFGVLNDVAYFSANDGIHGLELWRSDGTKSGTSLVKDIRPGVDSSNPSLAVQALGKLFFTTYFNDSSQLWVSDGTDTGTRQIISSARYITDIYAGENTVYIVYAQARYYRANEIWKTNGIPEGTSFVFKFPDFSSSGQIRRLTEVNNILYFCAFTYSTGHELWRSDGTSEGTFMIRDINADNLSPAAPMRLTNYNNRLFFDAYDGIQTNLWTADSLGTKINKVPDAGQVNVAELYGFGEPTEPFIISNNILYFFGSTNVTGRELFRYDTINGAQLVKDIIPGPSGIATPSLSGMVDVNNDLYFLASDITGLNLWRTKGNARNTVIIKSFNKIGITYKLYTANGRVYFELRDSTHGQELWKSEGTEESTQLLKDIYPGVGNSYPRCFTALSKGLLFQAYSPGKGVELWQTDGTTERTQQVTEINSTSTPSSLPRNTYNYYAPLANGAIVFPAYDKEHGTELYVSDGTTTGTGLIRDIVKGEYSSYPAHMQAKNNNVYFYAETGSGSIFKTDGTNNGTQLLVDGADGYADFTVTDDGLLFYKNSRGLWRSDGTETGTFEIAKDPYYETSPVAVGNKVYFSASTDGYNYELWVSDGATANTRMVKDINPGESASKPYSLFANGDYIFFGAYDGSTYSLWRSDGSKKGTIKLPGSPETGTYDFSYKNYFCGIGSTLFFSSGGALWKTDGTVAGTVMVKEIFASDRSPYFFTNAEGTLYFEAVNERGIYSLWKSDGTTNGTIIVKRMQSEFDDLCNVNGHLFFNSSGQLWTSNGKKNGTIVVNTPGMADVIDVNYLKASGNNLFFNGITYKLGSELYGGDVTGMKKVVKTGSGQNLMSTKEAFTASISPNPATLSAVLTLTENTKQVSVIINDQLGKTLWKNNYTGNNIIQLPVTNLPAGIYFVTINNGENQKTIKLLKL